MTLHTEASNSTWETDVSNSPTPKGSGWGVFWFSLAILVAILILISAVAHAAPVKLRWDANPEPDIAGYTLYWGTESGAYPNSIGVQNTRFSVEDLTPGTTYFFAVQATNTAGQTSEMSDEISYTVPAPPPAKPTGLQVVEIQTSADLETWETNSLVPLDPSKAPAKFIRARITTITPPEP